MNSYAYGEMGEQATWIFEVTAIEKANCYTNLYNYYRENNHLLSGLAAVKSLFLVVKYSKDVEEIIICQANLIYSAYFLGLTLEIDWLRSRSFEISLSALKGTVGLSTLRAISYHNHALMLTL